MVSLVDRLLRNAAGRVLLERRRLQRPQSARRRGDYVLPSPGGSGPRSRCSTRAARPFACVDAIRRRGHRSHVVGPHESPPVAVDSRARLEPRRRRRRRSFRDAIPFGSRLLRRPLRSALDVQADPRASWTQAQYVARYDFVEIARRRALGDRQRAQPPRRIATLRARRASGARHRHVYAQFTSGVVNSEDDLLRARPLARAPDDSARGHRAFARSASSAARARSGGDPRAVRRARWQIIAPSSRRTTSPPIHHRRLCE